MRIDYTDRIHNKGYVKGFNVGWVESRFEPANKASLWLDLSIDPPVMKIHHNEEWIPMGGGSGSGSSSKRTVVFIAQNYNGKEKNIQVFVPYRGDLQNIQVFLTNPTDQDLVCEVKTKDFQKDIIIPAGQVFIETELEGTIDQEVCTFTVLSGPDPLTDISASLNFKEK